MTRIYFSIAIALITVGCAKDFAQPSLDNDQTFEWSINALQQAGEGTKTTLESNQLKWQSGDKIGVFIEGRQTNRAFTNTGENGFLGSLVQGMESGAKVKYYAYYPFQPNAASVTNIEATLPASQVAPFDPSANFMTAKAVSASYKESDMPSVTYNFTNQLFGIVKIVVKNTDEALKKQKILGISMEAADGATLAGNFHFDATEAAAKASFSDSEKSSKITMSYPAESEPLLGTEISHQFYLFVNPVAVNGINVVVRTTDYVFTINSTQNVEFSKGSINVLPEINLNGLEKKKRVRTCLLWGDSITNYSYLNKMKELLGSDWEVIRAGVPGDSPLGICGRQGAIPLYMLGPGGESDKSFTIPASKTESVKIDRLRSTRTTDNIPGLSVKVGGATYFTNPGALFNPCVLSFKKGEEDIQIEGNVSADNSGNYYFTRSEDGEEINVPNGATVTTYGATAYRDADVHIIYMGANRGFASYDALVQFHQAMIDYTTSKKVVILGFHMEKIVWSPTSSYTYWTEDYRDAMKTAFGSRFVDMRTIVNAIPLKYLVASGAYKQGQTLSEEDLVAVNKRDWPSSLQNAYGTDVHPNPYGNYVMAILALEKMQELGYLNY